MYKDHPPSSALLTGSSRTAVVAVLALCAVGTLFVLSSPAAPQAPGAAPQATPHPQAQAQAQAQAGFDALHAKLAPARPPPPAVSADDVAALSAEIKKLSSEVEALKAALRTAAPVARPGDAGAAAGVAAPAPGGRGAGGGAGGKPARAAPGKAAANERQAAVREAFDHSWAGYKAGAWGRDELRPAARQSQKWANVGLTLVDALDTALLVGANDAFDEAVAWVEAELAFDYGEPYNLFEVTIRILGSLLSAHALTDTPVLAAKAEALGDALLPAFGSRSGVPYSDVVPKTGVASAPDAGLSSLAEVTTIQLEFARLADVSGRPEFKDKVDRVMRVILAHPTTDGLLGNRVSPDTGSVVMGTIKLGARGDSYYEYLLKQYIAAGAGRDDDELAAACYARYLESIAGIKKRLWRQTRAGGKWYVGEEINGQFSPKMDHLVCFLPGTLALGTLYGAPAWHLEMAKQLMETCHAMYAETASGLAPEIVYFNNAARAGEPDMDIHAADRHNLLRPETVESLWYLREITGDDTYREWGWAIFEAFNTWSRVESGGYTSVQDVTRVPVARPSPNSRFDKMESFWISETLKYFWLLFGDGEIDLKLWVMNTEGHPLPIRS